MGIKVNQILSMNQENPAFGNNYNNFNGNMNGGNKDTLDIKIVKRIFAIAVIAFGLVMFISGLIGVINYFSSSNSPTVNYPIVSTMQNDNILTLTIKNDITIDVVNYSWNNGRVSEISGNNSLELTRDITIPEGNNILKLSIMDVNGKLTEMTKSFVGIAIEDTTPPKIELVVTSSKLNIIAKSVSETKLSYLSYKWNNDPEIVIEANGDQTTIETTIDILNGTNTLTVVAMNTKGISDTQVKEFIGIKKPVIEVKRDDTGQYLEIKISHDSGIKAAEITFNDKPRILTKDHFGKKVVELRIKLTEKTNTLKIVATSSDDSYETFNGTAVKD